MIIFGTICLCFYLRTQFFKIINLNFAGNTSRKLQGVAKGKEGRTAAPSSLHRNLNKLPNVKQPKSYVFKLTCLFNHTRISKLGLFPHLFVLLSTIILPYFWIFFQSDILFFSAVFISFPFLFFDFYLIFWPLFLAFFQYILSIFCPFFFDFLSIFL